jgi:Mn-dependent DtxR family transcriptional regulator
MRYEYSSKELRKQIIQAIYTLSDDIDYNVYENVDIAEYIHADEAVVETVVHELYEEGYLGECMTLNDDGLETFVLSHKAFEQYDIKEY